MNAVVRTGEGTQRRRYALRKVGALDRATMRDVDARHLAVPATIDPIEIKRIRGEARASQPVFARYLDTSETGAKRPSGMALNPQSIVQKHGPGVLR